jgi:DNA-directed RNA polymerase specialized sigma24 family protein
MADRKDDEELPRHRILRDVLRHYLEFRDLVTHPEHTANGSKRGGAQIVTDIGNMDGVIEHGYFVTEPDGTKRKVFVTLSFWDLQGALANLSPRKKEAVFWNVIMDLKQKDVAEKMKITTVSVGQYVEQAMLQLSENYFDKLEIRDGE